MSVAPTMESDQHRHDARDSVPPQLPSKLNVEASVPPPDPPLTHSDRSPSRSPSKSSSPSRYPENALLPTVDGGPESLLTPPSPNSVSDEFSLVTPSLSPSPSTSSFKGKQNKKSNPLIDLVESEREYINLLGSIIKKVAGAWSRSNFPPKALDAMFRGIEAVYKANRGLFTKLKQIGPTPTSPKALGDLLMSWIDDLDAPYTKYCTNFAIGFDEWQPIASNTRLPPILDALSTVHPLPLLPGDEDLIKPTTWTLDSLFALPRGRLKYYKKLYTKLLKSTQAGRSDYKLLIGAVDRLENLLAMLTERENILVGQETEKVLPPGDANTPSLAGDEARNGTEGIVSGMSGSETADEQGRQSLGSSVPHTSFSSDARASRDAESPRAGEKTASSATMSMPISNLERRLSTEKTLDIFTLKPKSVRLQMNPPSLPFTRALRLSQDVGIHFTPRIAPESPQIHTRGHIFLLTDLFLVCERMTPEERQMANSEPDGQDYDMWLLYPPLAAKHLRVSEHSERENALQIRIMKKEMLFLHTESQAARDNLIRELTDCVEEATLLSPSAGQPPPPPVPSFRSLPSPIESAAYGRGETSDTNCGVSPAVSLVMSSSANHSPQPSDPRRSHEGPGSTHQFVPRQGAQQQSSGGPTLPPSGSEQMPTFSVSQPRPLPPPPTSNEVQQTQPISNNSSIQFIPPTRGTSFSQLGVPTHPMGPPTRPATTPDLPQFGGPPPLSTYPGQYPPRMQTASPAIPGPYLNGVPLGSGRPPSDTAVNMLLRESPSANSLGSQLQNNAPTPAHPTPPSQFHGGFPPPNAPPISSTMPHVHQPLPRLPFPPPATWNQRVNSFATTSSWSPPTREPSPPNSPSDEVSILQGPVISSIVAQFKCKVFLQLHHGQWKSLGGARLKLYLQQPTNVKQLVVEADSKDKAMLISTIVLTDGVERVGKTGVAIELSDKGARTGIVYMIQLRNEVSASGLFDSLLAGSDRAAGRTGKG